MGGCSGGAGDGDGDGAGREGMAKEPRAAISETPEERHLYRWAEYNAMKI